jgi:glycosyltransferase 2 family protein
LKVLKKIIFIVIITIIVYAIFLFISDLDKISDKILNFKLEFLPIILGLVIFSWIISYFRWNILLKNQNIHIPHSLNFQIFLVGGALGITPGKIGELFKSQILKEKFNIPRTKTAPLFIVEKFLDLVSAMIVTVIGIWFIPEIGYLAIIGLIVSIILFKILTSKKLFIQTLSFLNKIKFLSKYLEPLSSSHEILSKTLHSKKMFSLLILSVFYWIVIGCATFFVIEGFGFSVGSILNIISTYSSSLIIGALSFIPGGIGIAEGSLIGLLTFQGIDVSDAIVIVVLIRIFTLWFSTITGFIALKTSKSL